MTLSLRKVLPYLLMIILCILLVAVTEVSQITTKHFKYPYVLRYLNTITQIPIYIIIPIWKCFKLKNIIKKNKVWDTSIVINYKRNQINDNELNLSIIKSSSSSYKYWFICYSLFSGILVSSAGMILNVGLQHISVPTALAVSSFRAVFTLILSVIFLRYPLKLWNISAVLVSIIGILLYVDEISQNDTNDKHNDNDINETLYGCCLVLVSTFNFSLNDIICKKSANYCYKENRVITGNILFVVFNSIFTFPLFFWVLFYPKNIFNDMDSIISLTNILLITSTGILLIFVHVFGYIFITIKSPIYVSMAILLSVPFGFIIDILLHNYNPSYLCVLGALCLMLGFSMLELIKPSEILCPFCNVIMVNKKYAINKQIYDDDYYSYDKKSKLTDSFDDEYVYNYHQKSKEKNIDGDDNGKIRKRIEFNDNNTNNGTPNTNNGTPNSGDINMESVDDDIIEPMHAVHQSGDIIMGGSNFIIKSLQSNNNLTPDLDLTVDDTM